jgi:hypothetical protein
MLDTGTLLGGANRVEGRMCTAELGVSDSIVIVIMMFDHEYICLCPGSTQCIEYEWVRLFSSGYIIGWCVHGCVRLYLDDVDSEGRVSK